MLINAILKRMAIVDISQVLCCPLCRAATVDFFHRDARRDYYRCAICELVFVPPNFFLSAAAEKACYDHHRNSPADAGYRRFLGRLYDPLVARLAVGACGLDFGCGPGPTLSVMLAQAGYPTAIYDPFYAADETVWLHRYDFVTASEVVEHLHTPWAALQRLWQLLRPGGYLAVMTKRVGDSQAFSRWHYKLDPTHVIFFAEATFAWLAAQWGADCEVVGPDVVLLRRATGQHRSLS
jgi:SAM-dependent methyltransferase